MHRLSSRAFKSLIIMSNLCKINELLHMFFEEYLSEDLIISVFFLLIVSKLYRKLENYHITCTVPSYNTHQWLFVENLTDNPQIICRKYQIFQTNITRTLWQTVWRITKYLNNKILGIKGSIKLFFLLIISLEVHWLC